MKSFSDDDTTVIMLSSSSDDITIILSFVLVDDNSLSLSSSMDQTGDGVIECIDGVEHIDDTGVGVS